MTETDCEALQKKLLYNFKNHLLLDQSLRHSSFVNEQADDDLQNNERLEFLGDAVLNLVIGDLLMKHNPNLKEGDLSRMRASLVRESHLADIARNLDLGAYLQLGKGEIQTHGSEKNSILANAFEAVMAAVYLDGGFEKVYQIIERHFSILLDPQTVSTLNEDYKSQVQELTQLTHGEVPTYTVISESGPDHDKTFKVRLTLKNIQTDGIGKSKKMAEQDAARKGLEMLKAMT